MGRVTGTVKEFMKQRGFGYITMDNPSDAGGESKVFVHWKSIKTDDKWPSLTQGMKVEFEIGEDNRGKTRATNVSKPGGGKISSDGGSGSGTKIGGKHKGTVRFFNARKGSGMIELSGRIPGVELGTKNQIAVLRSDINTNDEPPVLKVGSTVQFDVYKTGSGYAARNVSGPRGEKIHVPNSDRATQNPRGQIGRGGGRGRGGMGRPGGFESRKRSWGGPGGPPQRGGSAFGGGMRGARGGGGRGGYGGDFKRQRRMQGGGRNGSMFTGDDETDVIEVGLCIRKYYVGGLIGKKGVVIREFKKESGAMMQFGDEDVTYDGDIHRVMALSGDAEQVSKACKMIAKNIGEQAQSLEHKLIFLVPEEYCGMLIGKKGSNIQKIAKGGGEQRSVKVSVSQEATQLPGANRVNMCTLYGGQKNVDNSIVETVNVLGLISQRIQNEQAMQAQQQPPPMMMGMGFGGPPEPRNPWDQRPQPGGRPGGRPGPGGWNQQRPPPQQAPSWGGRERQGMRAGGGGGWRR